MFTSNVCSFWQNVNGCPAWKREARRAFALTPNSASSERVFARLKAMFQTTQTTALSDYLEGSVMLAHNQRNNLR